MPSTVYSCTLSGIEAHGVEIEVDILNGLSCFTVVGLPDAAVNESKERVRSAMVNSGARFPHKRKVVNLAPADVRKCGPSFDLPIAVGLLMESGQIPTLAGSRALFIGELALDGSVRPTQGVLSSALFAKEHDFDSIFIPADNVNEAALAAGLTVFPVEHLQQLIAHLTNQQRISPVQTKLPHRSRGRARLARPLVFKGPETAVRALAVASAGGHHVLMSGPPGSGKTLLARQLPALLPPLATKEMIELTKIYSAAGLLSSERPLVKKRPFRAVHHTASISSLIGGGNPVRPGEIVLAHRGVLFLDEVPEFSRGLLESLRQPLEDRNVVIARSSGSFLFPCHFILVGAMNPCPCGYDGDETQQCRCSAHQKSRYQKKLSGPFLDRVDVRIQMKRLSYDELESKATYDMRPLYEQIVRARAAQKTRFSDSMRLNSDLGVRGLERYCPLSPGCARLLKKGMEELCLSARGYSRAIKVARTLADMTDSSEIHEEHLLEALQFRVNPTFH